MSHDRYFVDKIAKKLFIFKGDGTIEESLKPYSEYLDDEKELQEIDAMALEFAKPVSQTAIQDKPKIFKLTYNETRALETLPKEIELIEAKMDELNACLANPKCYEEKGIRTLADELEKTKALYEEKVEELLTIEEKAEEIEALKK